MDGIRRRVMKGVLARSMEQAQREEDAAYLSAITTDMRTLYDECFTPLFHIVFWGAILLCAIGMYLFVSPVSQNVARLRSMKGIRARIEALMEEKTAQEEGGGACLPKDGSVVCESVTFAYPDAERRVLDGLTLAVGEREKTALVGVSGCGKSTLAKLLRRYYGTYGGSIRVGGAELGGIAWETLLRHVGYISQRTFLFDDTIRHNISLYDAFTDEQMDEAVRLSGLAEYIASLPEGLDTRIAENGRNLSGGQAQRIGIARAAIRRYRVILADEITASMDEATSRQVMDNLLNMDATVIAIPHDTQSEFMKRFDSVYRIEDGKAKKQSSMHLTEDSEGFSLINQQSLL